MTDRDARLLAGCLPDLVSSYDALQSLAADNGIVIEVNGEGYGGLRSTATQAQLAAWEADSVAKGNGAYAVGTPGKSKHEVGAAVDVVITSHEESNEDAAYKKLADLGRSLGLVAGYYFRTVPRDPFHFELNRTLDVLREQYSQFAHSGADDAGRSLHGAPVVNAHPGGAGAPHPHGGVA